MTILSDEGIADSIKNGRLKITGFKEDNLTPNGYDLTIEEVFVSGIERTVNEGRAEVPPQTWFAIGTKERVEMSGELAAQLWIRTSWARKGVMASFGKIDAGFEGNLTLSAFNSSKEVLDIPIGETFAQMVFEKLERPAKRKYDERSGHFQNQKGIRLERTQ